MANLSLVGASFGVKVVCKSLLAKFQVQGFTGLNIVNMVINNCSGPNNDYVAFMLRTGSELNIDHVTVSSSAYDKQLYILFQNVFGSFLISNSAFLAPKGSFSVDYTSCDGPGLLNFSSNSMIYGIDGVKFSLATSCSSVEMLIADSVFENGNFEIFRSKVLQLVHIFSVVNTKFYGTFIRLHSDPCNSTKYFNFATFTGITANFGLMFDSMNCTAAVLIEDSFFHTSTENMIALSCDPASSEINSACNTFIQIMFQNVTFVDNNLEGPILNSINTQILFVNCTFENNTQSALQAINSLVIFQGKIIFKNNSALLGGAIQLLSSSHMYLRPNTYILFENNHADFVGGGIYIESGQNDSCFFSTRSPTSVNVNFTQNTANVAGSSLYSNGLKICCFNSSCDTFFDIFSNISNTELDPSNIASDPYSVCLCEEGKHQPDCSFHNRVYFTEAFPGQDFVIRLAVIGSNFDGVVAGTVRAFSISPPNSLDPFKAAQVSERPYCDNFNYSVQAAKERETVTFYLTAQNSLLKEAAREQSALTITVFLDDCPLGFSLSPASGTCVCDPMLNGSGVQCDINRQSFLRPISTWIGFVAESTSKAGVIFNPDCPIAYCSGDLSVASNTSDRQCGRHRTGLLCGKCEEGYSLTLGLEKCVKCSNTYLLLILPLAAAGLLLVALLFALNLTVAEGSINGLIFYANIIRMNHNVQSSEQASYLYTFLAWLNLDLGVSTCLFDGMDGYVETWLQFVFPIYLWGIVIVITQFYRRLPTLATRLGGENVVKVLATLLLLSYTKLQRNVITIMSFTWLEYPDGVVRYVWLYDANVEFFKGKHLYLSIAGILVLVFFIVPYTLCLTFFQQLQACSGHRIFHWVNKLKPIFDAYAGPYKDQYRFWTGMLLIVRIMLIILFTVTTAESFDIDLLIISLVSLVLLMVNSNGTYKKWPYNYLESFFYLQLGVYALGVLYARHNHGNITSIADVSIGLTLIIFLAVVGFHILCWATSFKNYYYRMRGYADIEEENQSIDDERK